MGIWSPVELFSREKLKEYQFKRFKQILISANNKKLYKEKFNNLGIDVHDIKSIDDIAKLPFTNKSDLVKGYHDGSFVIQPEDLFRWHRTSGSTGIPVRVPDTLKSWEQYGDLAAAALYGMGVRKDDVALVCFGYGPFIAFWSYIAGLDKIGACFVPAGTLSTTQRIEMIKDFNVTVLFSTPTYALHLAESASQIGVDLSRFLRLTVHTGEPCPPYIKRELREKIGVRPMDRFGTTETGGIAFECSQTSGIYHIQENYLIAEVVDPDTKESVIPGEIGELIITPLYRTEVPIIRFKTENLVKLADIDKCVCGRKLLSLEETENGVVIQRLDQLVKVRGVLINPTAIGEIIREFKEISEYQIIIQKSGSAEEVIVKAELLPGSGEAYDVIKTRIENTLKDKILIRCDVEFVPPNTLPRFEEKAKRFIDLRKKKNEGG